VPNRNPSHPPDPQRPVTASADQATAVGVEGQAPNGAAVALQVGVGAQLASGAQRPEADQGVHAAAGQAAVVGAEGQAGHCAGVGLQGVDAVAAGDQGQAQVLVVAAADQQLAVGAPGQAARGARVAKGR
jgi:hypothetical protein